MIVQMFKAAKQTRRFRKNQKVWITWQHGNHLDIRFKWRGRGRFVHGTIDHYAPAVGLIREIDVSDSFGRQLHTKWDSDHGPGSSRKPVNPMLGVPNGS